MPIFDAEHEARIVKACIVLNEQETPNIVEVAREYEVQYYQLRRRFHGTPNLSKKGSAQ
jgi:hypothetical protein